MNKDVMNDDATNRLLEGLREGFRTPEEVSESVLAMLIDVYGEPAACAAVKSLLPTVLESYRAEMRSWPAITDCDRLDAAFEELNARGIMARHDWLCCGNCGASAMPDEFDRLGGIWEGKPIIGYAFYHNQDTESAVAGYGLCLNYGSCEKTASEAEYLAKCIEIARSARDILVAHGLQVKWDGSYSQRPTVLLNWQRRSRPTRFCENDVD